jgi:hypothetical protein
MNNLQKMGGVTALLATTLSFSAPVHALSFTVFTNQAAFTTAAGSLSTENFNSFTNDASFNNGATVNLTDFSLIGFGNVFDANKIDALPSDFSTLSIDGTPFIVGQAQPSLGFNATFNSPITAFGATFNGISNSGTTQLRVGSDIVGIITSIADGSTGFYGFIANGSFSTITFENANLNGDTFGADNFLYGTVTPVPFEFSPAVGVGVLGGLWAVKKFLKKSKKN